MDGSQPACRRFVDNAAHGREFERDTLVAWLHQRLHADLADPVIVDLRRHNRCTVMRGIDVVVNRRRRAIAVRGRRSADPDDWSYGILKLDRPLVGAAWARAWWCAVRDEFPEDLREEGDAALAAELPALINSIARHSGKLRAARRMVLDALRLNLRLLDCARALSCDGRAHTGHYGIVWRWPRESRDRIRESSLLWPVYDGACVPPFCDLGALKRSLRESGLTRGGWIALCRHGRWLWWPVRRCHEFARAPRREIISLANLLGPAGAELPPPPLLAAVGRLSSLNWFAKKEAGKLLRPFRAAWRHMETLTPEERAGFVRGHFEDVLCQWAIVADHPKVPHGADWAWFERWAARQDGLRQLQGTPWPARGRKKTMAGVEILPLRDLRAVREAGMTLRNCMARAGAEPESRRQPLFLMRDTNGHALAMFTGYANGAVNGSGPEEIRGRYNREVDAELRRIARIYLCESWNGAK